MPATKPSTGFHEPPEGRDQREGTRGEGHYSLLLSHLMPAVLYLTLVTITTSTLTAEASSPADGFGQEQAAQVVSTVLLVIMHVGHSQVSEDF